MRSPFCLLLFDPPDFAALGAWPDLRALLLEHHDAAARWSGAVRRRHHEQFVARMRRRGGDLRIDRIVRRQEVRLGRASVPFTFTITELPLEGQRGWVVSPDEVIVTFDLLERTAAAEAFLDPVISALV